MSNQNGVYVAINRVQAALAECGITKDRTANQGGGGSYKYRGIDEVYNALSPLLAKHGLCILPRVLSRSVTERLSGNGKTLFYVVVEVEFDFVAVSDGSKHVVKTFGEAMDSGDKATNKAMSAAYKYAAFQAFAIPTEGDNDADATTHDVSASRPPQSVAHFEQKIMGCKSKEELEAVLAEVKSAYGNNPSAMEKIKAAVVALKAAREKSKEEN